jgi:hypothetical protein
MSANASKCQEVSANVSIDVDFVLEKSFLSATVSKCPQLSADVGRYVFLSASVSQQKDDDAGISNLAPARHRTDMAFASGQRVFVLQSQLSLYCRTFLEGPATHLALVFIACRRYKTKRDFAGSPWYLVPGSEFRV